MKFCDSWLPDSNQIQIILLLLYSWSQPEGLWLESNPFIPNHYPIPLTLGIRQADRNTT